MVEAAHRLPHNLPTKRDLIEFIKARLCPNGQEIVYCCNGEHPTNSILWDLKTNGENSIYWKRTTSRPSVPPILFERTTRKPVTRRFSRVIFSIYKMTY